MKNEAKSLSAKVLAAAVSLSSAGCVGFQIKSDLSALLSNSYNPEVGRHLEVGAALSQSIGEGMGTHSLRVGFLKGSLPPKEKKESTLKIGKLIDEDVDTVPGERDIFKLSLGYYNEAWSIRPSTWYALAALMGGGVEFVGTYSTDRIKIGNSDSIEVPNLNPVDKVKFFVDPSFEVRLGPQPYAVFPVRLNTKISFNGCSDLGCVEPGLSVGYTINWSGIADNKSDDNICDYLPERKNMPLDLSFEGKEEINERCAADYHQAEGGRHVTLTLYSCEPRECIVKYGRMVSEEKSNGLSKEVETTSECYGTERFDESGNETTLTCNLYNKIFKGEVSSTDRFSDNKEILDNLANRVKDKVERSLR